MRDETELTMSPARQFFNDALSSASSVAFAPSYMPCETMSFHTLFYEYISQTLALYTYTCTSMRARLPSPAGQTIAKWPILQHTQHTLRARAASLRPNSHHSNGLILDSRCGGSCQLNETCLTCIYLAGFATEAGKISGSRESNRVPNLSSQWASGAAGMALRVFFPPLGGGR